MIFNNLFVKKRLIENDQPPKQKTKLFFNDFSRNA